MKKLPKELLVYVFDHDEKDNPVYSVAEKVDEIPEDSDGNQVGVYTLNRAYKFSVKRELK